MNNIKRINIWVTKKEFKDLVRVKDGKTWHDFILELCKKKKWPSRSEIAMAVYG